MKQFYTIEAVIGIEDMTIPETHEAATDLARYIETEFGHRVIASVTVYRSTKGAKQLVRDLEPIATDALAERVKS